jgi:hypothetical protein
MYSYEYLYGPVLTSSINRGKELHFTHGPDSGLVLPGNAVFMYDTLSPVE